ncbi:hypothetical protein CEXT_490761 [Caerostris extrusa]|uniref:Uncharacterized protein n=1 Tax=Caerostris extrusa TaxID=172846 RepID=A0AAV4XN91_CAEEX|nr:hypothetical protein CEXT_490761 [Caerostris extrusa]
MLLSSNNCLFQSTVCVPWPLNHPVEVHFLTILISNLRFVFPKSSWNHFHEIIFRVTSEVIASVISIVDRTQIKPEKTCLCPEQHFDPTNRSFTYAQAFKEHPQIIRREKRKEERKKGFMFGGQFLEEMSAEKRETSFPVGFGTFSRIPEDAGMRGGQ